MSSITRKLKRKADKEVTAQLTEEQKRLPSGKVVTTPIKGEFLTLPLLGWCAVRQRENVPLVMLGLALLRDDKIRGMLHVELPIYKGETDVATVAMLDAFGWDGRVWKPGDEGWPTGDDANREQLQFMMSEIGLAATLTFPPDFETGNSNAQMVDVTRARGPFLMPPLVLPEVAPNAEKIQRLHDLCDTIQQFYPS